MDTNESILFSQMGLHPSLIKLLEEKGFTIPTPVQAQAIPLALSGRDILGSAQTGTGKTLAFSIPLMNTLLQTDSGAALVLTPTRELAQQVVKAIGQVLGHNSSVKTALLIGGEPIFKQLKQLRGRPRIIVGTPGRVIDHLERGTLKTKFIKFLVLDETDRMLDMGFSVQLDEIIKQIPEERQTLMFSATIPKSIERLTEKYLTNPERIAIGHDSRPAENITQEVIKVSRTEKYAKLVSELDKREGSVIIFVKTRLGADRLADKLCDENHKASAIHGDLRQSKRERVISSFRQGRSRIMVATDIAARGLDIPHIQHVINYDLPQCPEDYIHRIGRTARAGKSGFALCLVTPSDQRQWNIISRRMDPNYKEDEQSRSSRNSSGRRFSRGGGSRSGGSRSGGGGNYRSGGRSSEGRSSSSSRRGGFKRSGSKPNKSTAAQS